MIVSTEQPRSPIGPIAISKLSSDIKYLPTVLTFDFGLYVIERLPERQPAIEALQFESHPKYAALQQLIEGILRLQLSLTLSGRDEQIVERLEPHLTRRFVKVADQLLRPRPVKMLFRPGVGIRYGDNNLQGFEVVKRCLHWLR